MKYLILIIALAFVCTDASAQGFLNKLKKKAVESATKKTEERIERKMDEKIDESLDGVEDSMKNSEENKNQQQNSDDAAKMMSKMFGGSDIKLQENYNFDASFAMETESIQGDKKKLEVKMIMHLEKSGNNLGMEVLEADGKKVDDKGKSVMIFDNSSHSMLTLTQSGNSKIAMVMNLEGMGDLVDSLAEEHENKVKVNKTGKTKNILGYKCENYLIESEDGTTDAWITHDIDISTFQAFQFMQKQQKKKGPYAGIKNGFVLEALTSMKGEKGQTMLRVTEVNMNKKTSISTKGYTVMNLGNMGD